MNGGKICISVSAPTLAGFIELIDRAVETQPDMIELRFDSLNADELRASDPFRLEETRLNVLAQCSNIPTITTFRPKEYGGCRDISPEERTNFWDIDREIGIADIEEDKIRDISSAAKRICSFHDFNGVPEDLVTIFERMVGTGADIIKLAARIEDAADAIPVWKLLNGSQDVMVIPIGMGEAGKWTRILGLAHGSPITYASIDTENKTAPGQISADELRDVFRVKELDRETRVYGVVAGDTSYSLSPYMHNAAFAQANLNSVFVPLQVAELSSFLRKMVRHDTREIELNFAGLSVTNPHKQAIIPHLDHVDQTAEAIGAVNTVKVIDHKLHGFNTDAEGFIQALIDRFGDVGGAHVTVVGAGGAARACVYVLKKAGAEVTVLARDEWRAQRLAEESGVKARRLNSGDFAADADILVNATPVGTRGESESDTIATARELRNVKLVYDLVYNPLETRLLKEARIAGAKTLGGLDMLIAQGVRQFEIWTGTNPPADVMRKAIEEHLK